MRLPHNWSPRDYQLQAWHYLIGGGKHAELVWHRRSGKDELALHWAAIAAMTRPATYWHMLPEAAQARKAIWDAVNPHTGRRRIDEAFPHVIRDTTREHEMLIKFVTGATWQVIGSDNYNSLVGSPPAGVVYSEWALAKPEARAFLRPILAENGGWQLFVTTPRGPNHAKNSFESAEKDATSFAQRLPATKTSVFTAEQLDKERKAYIADHGVDVGTALFEQEYLCSFDAVLTGRMVFDRDLVGKALKESFKPKYRTEISPAGSLAKKDSGSLRVWDEPKPGARYVIGADVAEGLEHGDYSCAQVLDGVTGEQVAQWHGHLDPDKFGATLAAIGKRYNKALIGVERNNHGLTTLVAVRDTGYSNIYAQEDIERRNEGTLTKKLGWLTTSKSKFKIIDQLAAALRDGDHGIWDSETIKEMQTYVIDDGGSYNAAPGYFDDRVMALGIALEMYRHNYREPRKAVTTPRAGRVAADDVGGY